MFTKSLPYVAGMILGIFIVSVLFVLAVHSVYQEQLRYTQECYKGFMYDVSPQGVRFARADEDGIYEICTVE